MLPFDALTPTQFENLTFDLLQLAGMRNLVWRTPGADGGRDLEGVVDTVDLSGYLVHQRWYVECKHYTSALSWPIVWHKVAYADSRLADYLLIVTDSSLSPNCQSEVSKWNSTRPRPQIRSWPGYQLESLLIAYPSVAAKYGLSSSGAVADRSLQNLMFEITKSSQSLYVSHSLGIEIVSGLEANAALAELVSARLDQLRVYGRVVPTPRCLIPPEYDWLEWIASPARWEEIPVRAVLTFLHIVLGVAKLTASPEDSRLVVSYVEPRWSITPATYDALLQVVQWADLEMVELTSTEAIFLNRNFV